MIICCFQIDSDMFNKVLGYIKVGKEEGARCVTGGDKIGDKGYYIQPTVFADVTDNMRIAREEVSNTLYIIYAITYKVTFIKLRIYKK